MVERVVTWLDDRLGTSHFLKHALRKAFPDHWSFMLGEINVYCFAVLVATGTFLALNFDPTPSKIVYHGPYALLDGTSMSRAYASTLDLSFSIDSGLLLRQVHHWAALVFLAGIIAHMSRVFFTGAFRKPREINWFAGIALLGCAMLEGFTGYSLPDDLLSGIGLRIADAVALSVPVVGTWASFLLLGGAFPSPHLTGRLFTTHVFILPAVIAGLIGVHLAIVWRQKHTQFRGPGKREDNVVGSPLFPTYTAKSIALGLGTLAVLVLLGAFAQINPIWLYGPYDPSAAMSPAQPDWYVGWLDGALRMGPPWAIHLFGHMIPSPFFPAVLLPGIVFTGLLLWPYIEQFFTHDADSHNLLDRVRDAPVRTGVGVALLTFAFGLTMAGSGDVQARYLHVSVERLNDGWRIFCIGAPFVAFGIAYAVARELRESGGVHKARRVRIRRNASGGYDDDPVA
jgi:ubiquinol-cytochrome c reductase cytochrome b subunit